MLKALSKTPRQDSSNGKTKGASKHAEAKKIVDLLKDNGIEITPENYAALVLSNSACQGIENAWMKSFFDIVGDKEPNRKEIHLDAHFQLKISIMNMWHQWMR